MRTLLNHGLAFINLYICVCRKGDLIIGYGLVVRSWYFDKETA